MKIYRVKTWANNFQVYTTSLNRKVSKHGYYSYLSAGELLTESQVRKCVLSGKVTGKVFELIEVDKRDVVKDETTDRRFCFAI